MMKDAWTEADDAVEEVRKIRREISARFDHDPFRLAEFYMEYQEQFADRLIRADEEKSRRGRPAA
jgi:hypothetical protein